MGTILGLAGENGHGPMGRRCSSNFPGRSAVADGETEDLHIMFACIALEDVIPGEALNELYEAMVWSLMCAEIGVHPHCDRFKRPFASKRRRNRAGTRIAADWTFWFSQFEADWKYHKEVYGWRAYAHNSCCPLCDASKVLPALLFTKHGPLSGWRPTMKRTCSTSWRTLDFSLRHSADSGPGACTACGPTICTQPILA